MKIFTVEAHDYDDSVFYHISGPDEYSSEQFNTLFKTTFDFAALKTLELQAHESLPIVTRLVINETINMLKEFGFEKIQTKPLSLFGNEISSSMITNTIVKKVFDDYNSDVDVIHFGPV